MTETQRMVTVAQAVVAGEGEVLVTLGLGSCVAILLHDRQARVGGMAHVLLPDPGASRDRSNLAKFASTAVPHLVEAMEHRGARRQRLEGRLVGGASMFASLSGPGCLHMGVRNIDASRRALCAAGIPLLAEEVGREHGRSVYFYPADGRVMVRSVARADVEL